MTSAQTDTRVTTTRSASASFTHGQIHSQVEMLGGYGTELHVVNIDGIRVDRLMTFITQGLGLVINEINEHIRLNSHLTYREGKDGQYVVDKKMTIADKSLTITLTFDMNVDFPIIMLAGLADQLFGKLTASMVDTLDPTALPNMLSELMRPLSRIIFGWAVNAMAAEGQKIKSMI